MTTAKSNEINEPVFGEAQCAWRSCWHIWNTFLPDGCTDRNHLECPKCHRFNGFLLEVET